MSIISFWGYFKIFSRNVVKWWQIHITPILHIDNNKTGADRYEGGDGSLGAPYVQEDQGVDLEAQVFENVEATMPSGDASNKSNSSTDLNNADAMAVLNRINKEKDDERLHEIEEARRLREEEERVASIMNASKVDVGAFIEEGRHKAEESNQAATEEQLNRAQEIIDRLNREAAEDEAKKQAEIDAAKAQAQADGLLVQGDLDISVADEPTDNIGTDTDATDDQMRRAQEIIDRLNREAAEDEAKKQAEIDAAKAQAKEAGLTD